MTSPIDLVADWHAKFGVGLPTVPTFTPDVCALRIALLEEELAEYDAAKLAGNRVEMLDALCDLQYVLSGAVLHLGLRGMSDNSALMGRCRSEHFAFVLSLIPDWMKMDKTYFTESMVASKLFTLQRMLTGMIQNDGFGDVFEAAFLAVHENNCAKTWSSEDADDYALEYAFESVSRNPTRWIARNQAGKIIKPPGHSKVDLSEFVK